MLRSGPVTLRVIATAKRTPSAVAAEVDIGGREVAEALVVSVIEVIGDESPDLALQVLQQDPVLQRLMPAFDLALGLGMVGCASDVSYSLRFQPIGQITGDVG